MDYEIMGSGESYTSYFLFCAGVQCYTIFIIPRQLSFIEDIKLMSGKQCFTMIHSKRMFRKRYIILSCTQNTLTKMS